MPAFQPACFEALKTSITGNVDVVAEWIVVDDGSGCFFDAVFDTLPRSVRLLRLKENRGQAAARNFGLAHANSNWIKFLDADDKLDVGHLSALLNATKEGTAIPFAPTRHIFQDGTIAINTTWRDLATDPQSQLARMLWAPFMSHCGALFPIDLLNRIGGYDETLVTDEDGDLLLRLLLAGAHFKAVPSVHYHYIHHNGSGRVSSDTGKAKLAARLRVCDKFAVAFEKTLGLMPDNVRLGLALRLDKIALNYWTENRNLAHATVARARDLYPGYQKTRRWPVRLLRAIGGPSALIHGVRFFRKLRGRPLGGTQG